MSARSSTTAIKLIKILRQHLWDSTYALWDNIWFVSANLHDKDYRKWQVEVLFIDTRKLSRMKTGRLLVMYSDKERTIGLILQQAELLTIDTNVGSI